MEYLNNLIKQITDDCYKHIDEDIGLNELTLYVCALLIQIYQKKDYDKEIFEPYIRQLVARTNVEKYGKFYYNFTDIDNSKIVEGLLNIPLIEQRSEEWYRIKEDSVGASECASIFNNNPYCSRKQLIIKKSLKGKEEKGLPSIHINHGVKYEPVIQLIYCIKNNTKLYEFGSIKHPKLSMVSASPDGITPSGIMIEIKAPLAREITGIPPKYYWYQMQQQLQVCNLHKVDFVECKITEYLNFESYSNDFMNDKDGYITANGNYKGVLIACFDISVATDYKPYYYVYPPKLLKTSEIPQWLSDERKKLPNKYLFSSNIYWKVDKYSVTEVWRDDFWWNNNLELFSQFWDEVLNCRKNGIESLEKPKKDKPTTTRKSKQQTIKKYTYDSDEEDHKNHNFDIEFADLEKFYYSSDDDCDMEDDDKSSYNNHCMLHSDVEDDKPKEVKPKRTTRSTTKQNQCMLLSSDDEDNNVKEVVKEISKPKPTKKIIIKKPPRRQVELCLLGSDSD